MIKYWHKLTSWWALRKNVFMSPEERAQWISIIGESDPKKFKRG